MKPLKQQLESINRTLYIDEAVLQTAPEKIKGTLEYFTLGKYVSDDDLQKEYESRGLVPADIQTLVEHDTELDEKKCVATHWKDNDGKWCFAAFSRWDGDGRNVSVDRYDGNGWDGLWWFAGVRKLSLTSSDSENSLDTLPLDLDSALKIVKDAGYIIYKQM